MASPFRIAIVGASSLLGKELGSALRERRFPARSTQLLLPPGEAEDGGMERRIFAFADEAGVLEAFRPEALEGLDALFLAGEAEDAGAIWAQAQGVGRAELCVVDLTGGLSGEGEAVVAGIEPKTAGARLVVTAHPAAQAVAHLLGLLGKAGRWEAACATVFEPVSERGLDGIRELEQQTTRMLGLQPLPREVYDAPIAFNLRASLGEGARPSLEAVRERVGGQLRRLLEVAGEETPGVAVEVLQAPVFHACVVSLFVRYPAGVGRVAVEASLENPWVARGREYPDVVAAAGEEAIQIGPVRADGAVAGGYWVFATLDNLRRTAFSAVDGALAALRTRGERA